MPSRLRPTASPAAPSPHQRHAPFTGVRAVAGLLAASFLAAGCVAPTAPKKGPEIWWTSLNPADVVPSQTVRDHGPYHLWLNPSLGIFNTADDYAGDDTPWIDLDDDFRQKLADCMHGYDPAAVTLGDLVWARDGFLKERLGTDYTYVQNGRHDDQKLLIRAGKELENVQRYFTPIKLTFPGLFERPAGGGYASKVVFCVVLDAYWTAGITDTNVQNMTVYLDSFSGPRYSSFPLPKATFTQMEEKLVRALAVEGTEREVPGATAIDVETPRGRLTMYRPSDFAWRGDARERYVGLAMVQILNALPEGRLEQLREKEE